VVYDEKRGEIMTILKTNDLRKIYKKTHALDGVNLTIEQGDIYGFIGKNGAGKTTLIRLITGVAEATSGSFSLFGETDPKRLVKARSRIAAVVESTALHMNLSAYDNLKLQCILLGIPQPHDVVIKQTLDKVDLASLLVEKKKKAKNFSLGMRQRLGIAMALINQPEFLILDEPNNGLDPEGIRDMRELLLKLNKEEGLTILISSHILSELAKLATRYGFIDKGKLLKEITSADLNRESRQATVLTLNQAMKDSSLFSQAGLKDFELQGVQLKIFGTQSTNQYLSILTKANIEVIQINKEVDDLEAFFMNMIGGQ
jgi:ABC-2 type transport system ATP-binding protein